MRQYLRKAELRVGNAEQALDLSNLRFRFDTHQQTTQSPQYANIRIYNLSRQTVLQIQNEFTEIGLSAGYEAGFAIIFSGEIRQLRAGRESPTDTFLDILASDTDGAYNFSTINRTLAAGWTPSNMKDAVVDTMKPYGVTNGNTPPMPNDRAMPRGRVLYGMARDQIRTLAKGQGFTWDLMDKKLDFIELNKPLEGEAIVINMYTGMIGLPVQTLDGITVRCLLNSAVKRGVSIKLDNDSIQSAPAPVAFGTEAKFIPASFGRDGLYKVIAAGHNGDTRGNEWYTDIVCRAIDPTTGVVALAPDTNVDNRSGL